MDLYNHIGLRLSAPPFGLMAFLSLYSSSSKATTTPAPSSSHAAAADTTTHTTPTTKQRQDRQLPARPPLAQLFNADTTLVSMNTDEPMDPSTEDDRRKRYLSLPPLPCLTI